MSRRPGSLRIDVESEKQQLPSPAAPRADGGQPGASLAAPPLSARAPPQPAPGAPPSGAGGSPLAVLAQQRDVLLQLLQDSALEVQSLKRALAEAQAELAASQRHASELAGRLAGRAVRGGAAAAGAGARQHVAEFFEACERGDVPHVQAMLAEAPALARERDSHGRCGAHFAARGGALPVLRVLARAGADMAALDHSRRSALSYAARRAGNGSVVAWLLTEQGLPASNKDADGLTPLHHAVLAHSAVAVASLLAAGASTTALDSAGATPLALAQHLNDRICVPETQHVLEELGAPGGPKSG
jgi:hypothetical protein